MKKLFLLQVLYLFISNTSYSQCGILDNTFGISGKVSTTNFPPYIMKPYMVLIQPDQKIIAAGEARDVIQSGQYFSVVRYNTDGALDSSFGTNGIVIPNINPDTGFWVSDIDYLNSQNKIIVIGSANSNFIASLLRFNYNGTLDNSFDGDGIKIINEPNNFCPVLTVDQISGKIIVITSSVIFRLNQDGTTDTGFGVNGEITIAGAIFKDATTQPDRKIIISGSLNGNVAIWRLSELNGSPDNTFGTNGLANINYVGEAAGGIEIQFDNQIIVNGNNDFMVKLHPDGNPNPNFGTNGVVVLTTDIQTGGIPVDRLVLQADNKIVLTAYQFSNNPAPDSTDFVFQKFDSTGVPDASCGINGVIYTDFNDSMDFSYACAIQQDGKIVIVGLDENEFSYQLVRYLPSLSIGILAFQSKMEQLSVYPNPIVGEKQMLEYSLNSNEQLTISLIDQKGNLIRTFVNEYRNKGPHSEILNFDNSIFPGTYLLQLSNSKGKQCIKIIKK